MQRLQQWRKGSEQVFKSQDLNCKADDCAQFEGEMHHHQAWDIDAIRICASSHHIANKERAAGREVFLVLFQKSGTCKTVQDGVVSQLSPGDFVVFESNRRFSLEFPGPMEQMILRLPKRYVKETTLLPARRVTGIAIPGTTAESQIAWHFMGSFFKALPALTEDGLRNSVRSFVDVLATSILCHLKAEVPLQTSHKALQLLRVRHTIETHLTDPDLGPESLARRHGTSRRHLERLFAGEGTTISSAIWQRRLEKCYADLENAPLTGRTVTEIAHYWGFSSSAHFSRSFKQRYDLCPTALIAQSTRH
ncbi:MAG: helix-turn-helix domain-containing protein [Pseudomonadota bacterium]